MKYICVDLETGSKEYHGRKGNPFHNKIVALGMKEHHKDAVSTLDYTQLYWRLASSPGIGILVGHNIKFDLLHLWKDGALELWFRGGGRIWCTQLAEYILSGQRHKYPALRDIAVNKYACNEREKRMESYWERGIDTCDIPQELVLEDVRNDVLDTEKVMLQQVKQAKREGLFELIMEQMEGLLATTEMEFNGIYINKDIFGENKKKISQELEAIKRDLGTLSEKYQKDINFNSPTQLSLLFFGGTAEEECQVPILNELGVHEQYKTGANRGEYKYKKGTKTVKIKGLQLKPLDTWKTKKAGIYQTNEQVLQCLVRLVESNTQNSINDENYIDAYKIAKLMLKSRELEKLLGTYYTGTEKFIHDDGCIHPQFSHCGYDRGNGDSGGGTNTGRLSCTKPNVQNIPR